MQEAGNHVKISGWTRMTEFHPEPFLIDELSDEEMECLHRIRFIYENHRETLYTDIPFFLEESGFTWKVFAIMRQLANRENKDLRGSENDPNSLRIILK